jgi:hypothetical protein
MLFRCSVPVFRAGVLRLAIALVTFVLFAAHAGTAAAVDIAVHVPKIRQIIYIDVTPFDRVEDIKARLAGPSGIPVSNQVLTVGHREMYDGVQLLDYGVGAGPSERIYLLELVRTGSGDGGPILVHDEGPALIAIVDQTAIFGSQSSAAITDATLARVFAQAGRTGPSGPVLSGPVLSTMGGTDAPLTFWSSGGVMALSGLVSGDAHDLVIGADLVSASGSVIGAYAADSRMTLGTTKGASRALGLYGGFGIGDDWTVAAQIGLARARFEQSGTSAESLRRMAAVALSGNVTASAATVSTTVTLSGFTQTIPGVTGPAATILPDHIRETRAEIAVRATALHPLWQTGLSPFVDVSAGSVLTRSDLRGRDRDTVANLTLGLSGRLGAGSASVALTSAMLAPDLRGAGISAAYALRF